MLIVLLLLRPRGKGQLSNIKTRGTTILLFMNNYSTNVNTVNLFAV
jgi:hypothetical protein